MNITFDVMLSSAAPREHAAATQTDAASRVKIAGQLLRTDYLASWDAETRDKVHAELQYLNSQAFPKMTEERCQYHADNFFRALTGSIQRYALLLRNPDGLLIAAAVLDCGEVEYDRHPLKGLYFILNSILPAYQGMGLGRTIALKVFESFQPDVLMSTSYQAGLLHAWGELPQKGLLSGFEVYPRLECQDSHNVLITIPYHELDFAIAIFKQLYLKCVRENQEKVEQAVKNLTVTLVRKSVHGELYDFHPWNKHGRLDELAHALNATEHDGILLFFRRIASKGGLER